VKQHEGKDANGNDRVVYVDFDAWENKAEFVMKWFTKGKPIVVDSRLVNDTWDDKATGERRSKAKFIVNEVSFVPSSPSNGGSNQTQSSVTPDPEPVKKTRKPRQPVAVTTAVESPEAGFTSDEGDDDEDIPF
jgi:single-strand DNA-binding protein